MSQPDNPFVEFLKDTIKDPVAFVRQVWGVEPDPWQAEVLAAIGRGVRRISVRSGHGVGKSTLAAWAMLWGILTHDQAKVVVTAPSASQLFDALMSECKAWARRLPAPLAALIEVKSDRIELIEQPESVFISARTSRAEQPEALAGVHSEWVLLVVDEASGVPEAVFENASGSMSGENATTLLLGNPVRTSGLFFDTHHRLRDDWFIRKVSCLDSRRVSPDYIRDIARRYGENSNAYRIRVLGEFPSADPDCLIPMELIEAAKVRDIVVPPRVRQVWGLDVARFGNDNSALAKRRGPVLFWIEERSKLDTMEVCGWVKHEFDQCPPDDKPDEIMVDVIGLGAGVVDRLRELELPVRGINVAEVPSSKKQYNRLRDELWWNCREWFEQRECKIPDNERLIEELAAVHYKTPDSVGTIHVEGKDSMKSRGMRSPNLADALVLTFAAMAAKMLYGRSNQYKVNQPLNRGLIGVV
jgi:hypothetical protein